MSNTAGDLQRLQKAVPLAKGSIACLFFHKVVYFYQAELSKHQNDSLP